jgi:hypothetical protein
MIEIIRNRLAVDPYRIQSLTMVNRGQLTIQMEGGFCHVIQSEYGGPPSERVVAREIYDLLLLATTKAAYIPPGTKLCDSCYMAVEPNPLCTVCRGEKVYKE